ncbi:MAG: 16S rRNA (guanine(527)-N(7))-methyltransferase RsmG [Desulfatibacillum sp.]|nr:16S rRNA (guanine(527)-N(7))-methyltransferase RsmG [Desulfatibacillum sp.]
MTPLEAGSPPWTDLVFQGARGFGLSPDKASLDKCAVFARLLAQANQRVNLTSIRDPREMAVKHFADSLAPLSHIPMGANVADIGSGAGFPGLVMAIFRPDIQVASIETIRKKANFQRHAALELGLANVKIYNIRAENWGVEGEEGTLFDVVVCRALSDLPSILAWAAPILRPDGRIIAMKGRKGSEELADLKGLEYGGKTYAAKVIDYTLPIENAPRSLIIFQEQV